MGQMISDGNEAKRHAIRSSNLKTLLLFMEKQKKRKLRYCNKYCSFQLKDRCNISDKKIKNKKKNEQNNMCFGERIAGFLEGIHIQSLSISDCKQMHAPLQRIALTKIRKRQPLKIQLIIIHCIICNRVIGDMKCRSNSAAEP